MGASPEFQEDPLRGRVQTVRWFRATPKALQPGEADLLKVTDRGYQYGEGLFETLRTCSRRPVLLDAHLRRLSESARFLGIPLPSDLSAIPEALEQMLPDEDITIKIILSRGGAGRYAELDSHSLLSLQIFPYRPPEDEHYREGVTLHTVAAHRSATSPLHRHKTLNYLDSIMARREARSHDAYEALIINTDDFIAECSMSNIFFVLVELFTGIYSDMPEHLHYFQYLFLGLEGHHALVPWAWTSQLLGVAALVAMFFPQVRRNEKTLALACLAIFAALWMEKGLTLIIAGFVPNPLGEVTEYSPTLVELLITFGIYAIGALVLSGLYKIAITVRESLKAA